MRLRRDGAWKRDSEAVAIPNQWFSSADPAWSLFRTSHHQSDFQPSCTGSVSYLCPGWAGYMEKSQHWSSQGFPAPVEIKGDDIKAFGICLAVDVLAQILGLWIAWESLNYSTACAEQQFTVLMDMRSGIEPCGPKASLHWNAQDFAQSK